MKAPIEETNHVAAVGAAKKITIAAKPELSGVLIAHKTGSGAVDALTVNLDRVGVSSTNVRIESQRSVFVASLVTILPMHNITIQKSILVSLEIDP